MTQRKPLFKRGFTLIELLIVITIIGILAVALIPRISQAPARARDVQRKADINNIASALELYYSDNGDYPGTSGTTDCVSDLATDITGYLTGGTLPSDQTDNDGYTCTGNYGYTVNADNTGYILAAGLEITKISNVESIYCPITGGLDATTVTGTACTGAETEAEYYVAR